MTYMITVENITPIDALWIKHQLTSVYGLDEGEDFTWLFVPEIFHYLSTSPKHMQITFAKLSNATFFELMFVP